MLYGELRLTGGSSSSTGRLEINIDGVWGSVCSRNFAEIDGHVACRQLGFSGVINVTNVNNTQYVTSICVYRQCYVGNTGWATTQCF